MFVQHGTLYEEVVQRTERGHPMQAVKILSIFLQVGLMLDVHTFLGPFLVRPPLNPADCGHGEMQQYLSLGSPFSCHLHMASWSCLARTQCQEDRHIAHWGNCQRQGTTTTRTSPAAGVQRGSSHALAVACPGSQRHQGRDTRRVTSFMEQ